MNKLKFKTCHFQIEYNLNRMKNKQIFKARKPHKKTKTKRYMCSCGQRYESDKAVYNHINKKHSNQKSKFMMIDTMIPNQEKAPQLKQKDIKFQPKQVALMNLTDLTFFKISDMLTNPENQSQIQLAQFYRVNLLDRSEKSKLRQNIQKSIQKFISKVGLQTILDEVKEQFRESLSTFMIKRHDFNIIQDISRHFKAFFAWKIETQILLYFAKLGRLQNDMFQECSLRLWRPEEEKMKEIIKEYCTKWEQIRNQL